MEHVGSPTSALVRGSTFPIPTGSRLGEQSVRRGLRARAVGRPGREYNIGTRLFPTEQVPALATSGGPDHVQRQVHQVATKVPARSSGHCSGSSSQSEGLGSRTPRSRAILVSTSSLPFETIQATYRSLDPTGRPRVQGPWAAFQDWFHHMGGVKERFVDRVVDLSSSHSPD